MGDQLCYRPPPLFKDGHSIYLYSISCVQYGYMGLSYRATDRAVKSESTKRMDRLILGLDPPIEYVDSKKYDKISAEISW